MKLASLNQGRDGVLIVVSRDLTRAVKVPQIAATLQAALDDWASKRPQLETVYQRLNDGLEQSAFAFDQAACHSPLPRAYSCSRPTARSSPRRARRSTRWRPTTCASASPATRPTPTR